MTASSPSCNLWCDVYLGDLQGNFYRTNFHLHSQAHTLRDTSVGREKNVAFGSNLFILNVPHVAVWVWQEKKLKNSAKTKSDGTMVQGKRICKQAPEHFCFFFINLFCFSYLVLGIVYRMWRRSLLGWRTVFGVEIPRYVF